ISEQNLAQNIAVIYKNDDVYSTGIYNTFATKAEELGLEIVSTTTFTTDSQTDFSVQIADAKDNGADLVFLPMYYDAASLILTQANAIGYAPKFFGVDGMDGILTVEGFDTALAEGVILLTPFSPDAQDDATVNFVTKYQEAYGEIPNQFAADAYDCVYAIAAALEASGATVDMTASELCDLLVATFTGGEFSYDGLTGAGMTWDETGAVTKAPKGVVIENGVYVGLD
ncbi:MAG: ABC transporter substrate-binding protein, partial [Oscillospiraceae bacterium]|nr:ABC transporter substrate-binding protein [Oscillospiraceae bacterium]